MPLQFGKNQMYPASAMALLECIDQTLNSGIQFLDLGVSLHILMNWQYLILIFAFDCNKNNSDPQI